MVIFSLAMAFSRLTADLGAGLLVEATLRPAYAPLGALVPGGLLPEGGLPVGAGGPRERNRFAGEAAREAQGLSGGYACRRWPESGRGALAPGELSVPEAAAALGVDAATIRRAIRRGKLAAARRDGRYGVDPESLEALRAARAAPRR